jgi:uncharacterized membrane protein
MAWWFFLAGFSLYSGALALRHTWFQTSAWDLAIFDQATYLIAQGWPAQSSLLGFHILGDHGALVLYPVGWLSRLVPSVGLWMVLQSAALAATVFPLDQLGQLRGLARRPRAVSLAVLLLYPVMFNSAIFDVHPEVLALPLVLQALLLLERSRPGDQVRLVLCLLLTLTCKLALALLVLGFAGWLLLRRRLVLGVGLASLALAWAAAVGGLLMPAFGGPEASLLRHAGKFGMQAAAGEGRVPAALSSLSTVLGHVLSPESLAYLLLLLVPVLYVLLHRQRGRFVMGLLPFLPLLLLNLAAEQASLKDLVHHYSLFLVPFLAAGVQQTLAPGPEGIGGYGAWLRPRLLLVVLGWAVFSFVLLSRLSFFAGPFQQRLDTLPQVRAAMAFVRPEAALLTTNDIAPHLARRPVIAITAKPELRRLDRYDQILLDRRHPGWKSSPRLVEGIMSSLQADPCWRIRFQQGDVVLFEQQPAASGCRASAGLPAG